MVERTIRAAASRLEKRDLTGLMGYISPAYLDFENRDIQGLRALVEEYFKRYRGIVIHVLATHIEIGSSGEAVLEGDAVLSSGAAEVLRKAFRFFGEYYRFKVELEKPAGRWLIKYAEWRPERVEELFPESRPLLKELFPGN